MACGCLVHPVNDTRLEGRGDLSAIMKAFRPVRGLLGSLRWRSSSRGGTACGRPAAAAVGYSGAQRTTSLHAETWFDALEHESSDSNRSHRAWGKSAVARDLRASACTQPQPAAQAAPAAFSELTAADLERFSAMEASDGTILGRDGGMVTDKAQLDQYNMCASATETPLDCERPHIGLPLCRAGN